MDVQALPTDHAGRELDRHRRTVDRVAASLLRRPDVGARRPVSPASTVQCAKTRAALLR
jgi:hypothetical protein